MREFLNAILAFVGATSLTDVEFDSLTITGTWYEQATYDALAGVLTSRGAPTETRDRLNAFFVAKGIPIEESEPPITSNIFIGGVLD